MMLGKLTRFPGTRIPAEALSGHSLLNAYLTDLDSRLLGSARVRLQTLAEVRDHLEESARHHTESGLPEDRAMELAIQAMPGKAQAMAQRAELLRRFVRVAVPSGLLWGVSMAAFWSFMPGSSEILALVWMLWLSTGVLFGAFLGWYTAFIMPQRLLTTTPGRQLAAAPSRGISVSYSPAMQRLGACMSIFFALMAPAFLALGVIGMFNSAAIEVFFFPWWACLLLAPVLVFDFFMVRLAARRYEARDYVIVVRDFLALPLNRLTAVGNLSDVRRFLPYYWKRVHYAEFKRDGGKAVRLLIYPTMLNAGRLFAMLQQHLEAKAQDP
jgi:hypothetical protein